MRKTFSSALVLIGFAIFAAFYSTAVLRAQTPQSSSEAADDSPATAEETFLDATGEGKLDVMCKMLQDNPGLLTTRDEGQATALHIAVAKSKLDIVKFLLEKKADVNAKDQQGETPLLLAITADEDLELARLLLAAKADPNIGDADGNTPLHLATERDIAELLLANGATLAAKNNEGRTPLHEAVNSGSKLVVEVLLDHNAM